LITSDVLLSFRLKSLKRIGLDQFARPKAMIFYKNHLYHIYNQGNNRQPIFFSRDNYLFFIEKIRKYVLPFADVLAWCLMPNHFHLMVCLNQVELAQSNVNQGFTQNQTLSKTISLNHSIGVMLRSYTRAINKQENNSGALFRQQTKAICLTTIDKVAPAWYQSNGVSVINIKDPIKEYPNVCFNYINFNPTKDGLVENPDDWEFCSYPDIIGLRKGTLINKERIKEFGLSFVKA